MTTAVREMFLAQAAGCDSLGSPLTARVLRLLAAAMTPGHAIEDRVLGWQGDLSRAGDALALRLAGGLHGLVLSGAAPDLAAFYHAPEAVSDAEATAVLLGVIRAHPAALHQWLDHPPQTNEIRRSAVLIAAGHWLTAQLGLPLVLSELGASAGLNLLWDRYALEIGAHYGPKDAAIRLNPVWHGALLPEVAPQVAARAGVDLQPLDPVRDRVRALSYIWADQPERLARTAAGLDALATYGPVVSQGDAIDWLAQRLAEPQPGHLHLIYHTIAWQYFPATAKARGLALLEAAGARATLAAPLAHLAMEADAQERGAALTLRLWCGGPVQDIALGRADFHGRWVEWCAPSARV
ncbi:DUF2332 domain-containing protein [Cypionkella psychrotolerans]|uniref:DUF2332 domain-containing protein n=1 Tax=Cypionkella psychrotolerans TaxID=1678131 RepID=UPI0006B40307|nr:DUF2332 family protein [Cypionkella psychrotolerans]